MLIASEIVWGIFRSLFPRNRGDQQVNSSLCSGILWIILSVSNSTQNNSPGLSLSAVENVFPNSHTFHLPAETTGTLP